MTTLTSKEVDAIAADWAARIDRGALTADEEQALAEWMDGDVRNRGAFMRMRAIALHSERARALGPAFDPDEFVARHANVERASESSIEVESQQPDERNNWLSRYRRALIGVAAAAVAAMAILIGLQITDGSQDYDTRRGEIKVVSLNDGSVITLNTASRVEVSFNQDIRKVRLIQGEALFDVAKDSARPFVVAAGDASVRAIGTSFTVRRLAQQPVQVLVREGVVEVQQPASPAPLRLVANMRTEIPAESGSAIPQPEIVDPDELNRELAWRDGRIAFEAETLEQAAAVFERYSDIRIVIDDPIVASKEITGLFTANDPITFAKAAGASLGLNVEVRAGEVHISQ